MFCAVPLQWASPASFVLGDLIKLTPKTHNSHANMKFWKENWNKQLSTFESQLDSGQLKRFEIFHIQKSNYHFGPVADSKLIIALVPKNSSRFFRLLLNAASRTGPLMRHIPFTAKLYFYNDNQPCHFWDAILKSHTAARITHKNSNRDERVERGRRQIESECDSKPGHNLTLKLTEIEIHEAICIPNSVCSCVGMALFLHQQSPAADRAKVALPRCGLLELW